MRVCQICDSTGKRVIMGEYERFALFECTQCGHRYVDGIVDQAYFDNYYLTQYTTDDKPYSDGRLASLTDCVMEYKPDFVLDIGGMDGELKQRFEKRGLDIDVQGVGDKPESVYDAVILSHTLEHIYDVGAMYKRIGNSLKKSGLLFVEIPIHLHDNYLPPAEYDFHWQHINKFRPRDIEALFVKHGYKIELSQQIEDYREYKVWRIVGRK